MIIVYAYIGFCHTYLLYSSFYKENGFRVYIYFTVIDISYRSYINVRLSK